MAKFVKPYLSYLGTQISWAELERLSKLKSVNILDRVQTKGGCQKIKQAGAELGQAQLQNS